MFLENRRIWTWTGRLTILVPADRCQFIIYGNRMEGFVRPLSRYHKQVKHTFERAFGSIMMHQSQPFVPGGHYAGTDLRPCMESIRNGGLLG